MMSLLNVVFLSNCSSLECSPIVMVSRLLTHNPFRVLGVFSNSPKKDVLSNLNKMRAFIKVGKQVSYPLDLPEILTSIQRDEAVVSAAQKAIELPKDRIKHSLFWFMNASPQDEAAFKHLTAGNIAAAKELWGSRDDISSLLNLMACAMIEGDLKTMAVKADAMFRRFSVELCSIVGETVRLSPVELTELFVRTLQEDGINLFTTLLRVPGTSYGWRKIVGSCVVEPIVEKIKSAIDAASKVRGGAANYEAGRNLMNATKSHICQLREALGKSDMQYQMVADALATAILQCGVNYYNEIHTGDAPQNALELQQYALSIAEGQIAKQRCEENVRILKCNPLCETISNAINRTETGSGAAALAVGRRVINETKFPLSQLAEILGRSSLQYQQIADAVAAKITECGISYFNESNEYDGAQKALELQNIAFSIAAGSVAKSKCQEFVNQLKDIIKTPEYAVRKESEAIVQLCKEFGVNPAAALFSNYVSDFVRNAKVQLQKVEHKIGSNSKLYHELSSGVANRALNVLIDGLNACITNTFGPLPDVVVSEAQNAMNSIGSLYMYSDVRSRYEETQATLNKIARPKPVRGSDGSGSGSGGSSGGCYIATMAYGDYDHPQVMVLRRFRDLYLSKRAWGRRFIDFYYANSPRWVEVLKGHKHINALIRRLLDSFVFLLKKSRKISYNE